MLGARIIDISSFKRRQNARRIVENDATVQPILWILLSGKMKTRIVEKHKDFYKDIIWDQVDHTSDDLNEQCDSVQNLADFLLQASYTHAYDRLIIIAPAKTIDEFHQILPLEAQASVCAQISEDLSHLSLEELQKSLEDIVVI